MSRVSEQNSGEDTFGMAVQHSVSLQWREKAVRLL